MDKFSQNQIGFFYWLRTALGQLLVPITTAHYWCLGSAKFETTDAVHARIKLDHGNLENVYVIWTPATGCHITREVKLDEPYWDEDIWVGEDRDPFGFYLDIYGAWVTRDYLGDRDLTWSEVLEKLSEHLMLRFTHEQYAEFQVWIDRLSE